MTEFRTRSISFGNDEGTNRLKISNLCELISDHPYKDQIYKQFGIESIENEFIFIDNIKQVFNEIKKQIRINNRFKIFAERKNIDIYEEERLGDDSTKKLYFLFDEYVDSEGTVKENLKAEAIYGAKNSFFDEFEMTKYANSLLKKGLSDLVKFNTEYFKKLAENSEMFNKYRSYRMIEREGNMFLRGITSERYNEYGVDFTFVVAMLALHNQMKNNVGINYHIKSCWVSESKLEMIIVEKSYKEVEFFGKVSTAIKVSTNDLGQGSLNFINTINISSNQGTGFFLFPREIENGKLYLSHSSNPDKIFDSLKKVNVVLDTSDQFISDLKEIKTIKTPDEIRVKILARIESPRSSFKGIKKISDIFKRKISNEIDRLYELFEMCNKAEELDLEFELKDKLRYIISDYVLYGKLK